ncbi:MAG: hypothetical protein AAF249_04560 [Pseudomonadota bacterium]
MRFTIAAALSLALGTSSVVFAEPSMVAIDFKKDALLTVEEQEVLASLASCIVKERKGMAKKFLRKKGDEKLRYLGPLISVPCRPDHGTRLNVPSLEAKLREVLDA